MGTRTKAPAHMPEPRPAPLFARTREAAELFGTSKATLYRWIKRGLLTKHKRGAATYLEIAEIRRVITGAADQEPQRKKK